MSTKPLKSFGANPETSIASLLVSLTRSMYRTMRSVAPSCSFLEMKTLSIIHEQKNPSMKYIADELGISSPAVTAIINQLIEDKAVVRREDPNDRRMTRISLTPSGAKTYEKNRSTIFEAFNDRASILTKEEQQELIRMLTKLQSNQ